MKNDICCNKKFSKFAYKGVYLISLVSHFKQVDWDRVYALTIDQQENKDRGRRKMGRGRFPVPHLEKYKHAIRVDSGRRKEGIDLMRRRSWN